MENKILNFKENGSQGDYILKNLKEIMESSMNKGVDLNVISHLMGHSSTWVTRKVYSKYLPETLSGIVNEKLNFKFN